MRALLFLLASLGPCALVAQDSSRVAPAWVFEILLGGGKGDILKVRTGPDETKSMDLAGWFHLRFAGERGLGDRLCARLTVGFSPGSWENGRGGNPYGAPSDHGDRWDIAAGMNYQVFRGQRSQFCLATEVRGVFGMDVYTDYRTDTAWVASSFQNVRLFYQSAFVPQLSAVWRLRIGKGPFGATVRIGAEHYAFTYRRSELSAGLAELPTDLLPLTGTHAGFACTWSIGFFGWQ